MQRLHFITPIFENIVSRRHGAKQFTTVNVKIQIFTNKSRSTVKGTDNLKNSQTLLSGIDEIPESNV